VPQEHSPESDASIVAMGPVAIVDRAYPARNGRGAWHRSKRAIAFRSNKKENPQMLSQMRAKASLLLEEISGDYRVMYKSYTT
jgi:hypothetical protein